MPGSETFNMHAAGGAEQETPTLTAVTGEFARIRFESRRGDAGVFLKIVANGETTHETIRDPESWASGALMNGDVVSLVCNINQSSDSAIRGILEVGT